MLPNVPIQQIGEIASNGSPTLLHMVGRAFGLGQAEREALMQGDFPGWFWIALGGAAGIVGGIYLHKTWPAQVDKLLKVK